MTALAGAGISAAGSLIGGLFGGPKKTTTTTTPTFTPQQQQLQGIISGTLQDRLKNPVNLDPLQVAASSQVNKNFDNAQTSLEANLAAKGFANSGKLVTNSKNLAIAKAGAQGSLASQFAAMQIDQNNKTLDDAQRFSFSDPGSTSTGVQTQPGGVVGGAIAGGAQTASLLYALNHFMGGGSTGSGGGGGYVDPNYDGTGGG